MVYDRNLHLIAVSFYIVQVNIVVFGLCMLSYSCFSYVIKYSFYEFLFLHSLIRFLLSYQYYDVTIKLRI